MGFNISYDDMQKAVGFGSSILSARKRKGAADQSFNYNRGVNRYNRTIARERTMQAAQAGAAEFSDLHRQNVLLQGQMRADAAARGVAVNEGSAMDVYAGIVNSGDASEARTVENAYSRARAEYDAVQQIKLQEQMSKASLESYKQEQDTEMYGSMFSNVGGFVNTMRGFRLKLGG